MRTVVWSCSGPRVILSSSWTTAYTADLPRDRPRTIAISQRTVRAAGAGSAPEVRAVVGKPEEEVPVAAEVPGGGVEVLTCAV